MKVYNIFAREGLEILYFYLQVRTVILEFLPVKKLQEFHDIGVNI